MKLCDNAKPERRAHQRQRQRGVTSIEYGLIAALIAIAIIGALTATGGANGNLWTWWTNQVIAALTP